MAAPFAVQGLHGGQSVLLGIWQTPAAEPVSFGVSDETAVDEEIVWSVSLPHDPTAAAAIVGSQAQALRQAELAMVQSQAALQILPADTSDAVSFALGQPDAEDAPEAVLYRHLAKLKGDEADVSFGLFDSWPDTVSSYQQFVSQTLQLMKSSLRVETQLEDVLYACTHISLTGDHHTLWSGLIAPDHIQLHQQVLSLTLQSRQQVFTFLAQALAGAAVLAVKFSLPGGVMTAVPAAWRYIRDVMTKSQALASSQRQIAQLTPINETAARAGRV